MGATVTVASKLPMRLELQCSVKRMTQQKHLGQMWKEEIFYKSGPMQVIWGTAHPNGQLPAGMPPRPRMIAGYALTDGVDKELWDAWAKENADSALIKNRLVFAFEKLDSVQGRCREFDDVNSGLGALGSNVPPGQEAIPDNDRRLPKKIFARQTAALPESSPDSES
jgi:hypothetical protein